MSCPSRMGGGAGGELIAAPSSSAWGNAVVPVCSVDMSLSTPAQPLKMCTQGLSLGLCRLGDQVRAVRGERSLDTSSLGFLQEAGETRSLSLLTSHVPEAHDCPLLPELVVSLCGHLCVSFGGEMSLP